MKIFVFRQTEQYFVIHLIANKIRSLDHHYPDIFT